MLFFSIFLNKIPAYIHSQKTKLMIFPFQFSALFSLIICMLKRSGERSDQNT